MKKVIAELAIAGFNILALTVLFRKNRTLKKKLEEQTDKHWSGNMQIALYDDEIRRLKDVVVFADDLIEKYYQIHNVEYERRHYKCLGCPYDGVVCKIIEGEGRNGNNE